MSNHKELVNVFKQLKWDFKQGANGKYVSICCPFAKARHEGKEDNSPSLVVWPDFQFFRCYSCGLCGSILDLFDQYSDYTNEVFDYEFFQYAAPIENYGEHNVIEENIELNEAILDNFDSGQLCRPYLMSRKIDKSVIEDYNLKFCKASKNLLFPVYSPYLMGISARSTRTRSHLHMLGMSTALALGGFQHQEGDAVVIVEGVTDLLKIAPYCRKYGMDVYCTFTCSLSKWQSEKIIDLCKPIHILWDCDKAGLEARNKLRLSGYLASSYSVINHTWKGEYDAGDMDEELFKATINKKYEFV